MVGKLPGYPAIRRGASGKAFPNGVWEREKKVGFAIALPTLRFYNLTHATLAESELTEF